MPLRAAVGLTFVLVEGCGVSPTTDFPNSLRNTNGQVIVVEDVQDIVNDPDLSDDDKRAALRNLGLQDDALIGALLAP